MQWMCTGIPYLSAFIRPLAIILQTVYSVVGEQTCQVASPVFFVRKSIEHLSILLRSSSAKTRWNNRRPSHKLIEANAFLFSLVPLNVFSQASYRKFRSTIPTCFASNNAMSVSPSSQTILRNRLSVGRRLRRMFTSPWTQQTGCTHFSLLSANLPEPRS